MLYLLFYVWVYLCITSTTCIAGEWLNNLIFHNDSKRVTANGQIMINVSTSKICHVTITHFVQKFLEVLSHS